MGRQALLIGCNYAGSQHELKGCISDVKRINGVLQSVFGFQPNEITLLCDDGSTPEQPTGHNIKEYLGRLVQATGPGDIAVIHYSGHGTQVPNTGTNDETDGKDEALVPCDMNLLLDDDIKVILGGLAQGVNCTFVCDCCHSGSMTDGGHHAVQGQKRMTDIPDFRIQASSAVMDANRDMGEEEQGQQEGGLFSHLKGFVSDVVADMAGDDFPKREIPADELFAILGDMIGGKVNPQNVLNVLGKLFKDDATVKTQGVVSQGLGDDRFVLISGCQDHETSADCPPCQGKPARGALTDALCTVLEEYTKQHGRPPTYRTAVLAARNILLQQRIAQNPCLEASEQNADMPFLHFNN